MLESLFCFEGLQKLFVVFYFQIVCYIYFTRIIVYLLKVRKDSLMLEIPRQSRIKVMQHLCVVEYDRLLTSYGELKFRDFYSRDNWTIISIARYLHMLENLLESALFTGFKSKSKIKRASYFFSYSPFNKKFQGPLNPHFS